MHTCPHCGASLSPEWKYCIYCGTTVTQAAGTDAPEPDETPTPAPASASASASESVDETVGTPPDPATTPEVPTTPEAPSTTEAPNATEDAPSSPVTSQSEAEEAEPKRRKEGARRVATERRRSALDIPLLIGLVLGVSGIVLIVYMGILLFGPQ